MKKKKKWSLWPVIIIMLILFFPVGLILLFLKLNDLKTDHRKAGWTFLIIGILFAACGLLELISANMEMIDPAGVLIRMYEIPLSFIPTGLFVGSVGLSAILRSREVRTYRRLIYTDGATGLKELAQLTGRSLPSLAGRLEELIRDQVFTDLELSYRDSKITLESGLSDNVLYCAACGNDFAADTCEGLSCPRCGGTILLPHKVTPVMAGEPGSLPGGISAPVLDLRKANRKNLGDTLIIFMMIALFFSMSFFPIQTFPFCLIGVMLALIIKYVQGPRARNRMLFAGTVLLGSCLPYHSFTRSDLFLADPVGSGIAESPLAAMLCQLILFGLFLAGYLILRRREREYMICRRLVFHEQVTDPEEIAALSGIKTGRVQNALKHLEKESPGLQYSV